MFTDPFGLKADTVEYASSAVKKGAEGCAQASKTCAQQLSALQNDPSKWLVKFGSLPGHRTGNTNTQGYANQVTGGTITIDPSHFGVASKDLGVTVNFILTPKP